MTGISSYQVSPDDKRSKQTQSGTVQCELPHFAFVCCLLCAISAPAAFADDNIPRKLRRKPQITVLVDPVRGLLDMLVGIGLLVIAVAVSKPVRSTFVATSTSWPHGSV